MTIRRTLKPLGGEIFIDTTPIQFGYTGALQEYTVPAGCRKLQIECVAAAGLGGARGGRVVCVLKVSSKQKLYIWVGKVPSSRNTPEYNASDVRTSNAAVTSSGGLNSRLIVAGAGGNNTSSNEAGGVGGGLTGGNGGTNNGSYAIPPTGGSQTAGGNGGTSFWGSQGHGHNGRNGSLGLGGSADSCGYEGMAGAGGAGYFGGGGGSMSWNKNGSFRSGGGGGSSYADSGKCSDVTHTQGYAGASGNGYVIFTPMK